MIGGLGFIIIIESDVALCLNCSQAKQQKKLTYSSNADDAFISKGFSNWKDDTVKFVQQASSNCHKEADGVWFKGLSTFQMLSTPLAYKM